MQLCTMLLLCGSGARLPIALATCLKSKMRACASLLQAVFAGSCLVFVCNGSALQWLRVISSRASTPLFSNLAPSRPHRVCVAFGSDIKSSRCQAAGSDDTSGGGEGKAGGKVSCLLHQRCKHTCFLCARYVLHASGFRSQEKIKEETCTKQNCRCVFGKQCGVSLACL